MHDESPVNALPALVLAVFFGLAGVELVLMLAQSGLVGGARAVGWRAELIQHVAFVPKVWDLLRQGDFSADLMQRVIAYPLVHMSFTHAAFALALWLALGKFVGDLFRPAALAIIAVGGVLGGAVAYGVVGTWRGLGAPLVGAYPAVYALIGAFTYVMWLRMKRSGENEWRAFTLIGMLMGLQLAFGLLFGEDPTWVADLGACLSGGILAILVAPGGWAAFLARLRQR